MQGGRVGVPPIQLRKGLKQYDLHPCRNPLPRYTVERKDTTSERYVYKLI